MDAKVKLLVLDVLKPHEPNVVTYAQAINALKGIDAVNISVVEFDARTESLKLTIKGQELNLDEIAQTIRGLGGSIHSLDRVLTSRINIGEVMPIGGPD